MIPQTWRSTIVGVLVIGFVIARIAIKHEAAFDSETIALLSAGCALIAGTDKLLGR